MTDQTSLQSTPFSIGVGLDVGIRRAGRANQDNIGDYADVSPNEKQLAQKGLLYLLADGMGGAAAGDTASEMAVRLTLTEYYQDEDRNIDRSLEKAIQRANRQIHERGLSDPNCRGMGTTLVGLVLRGNRLYIANVGDSRAYLLRHGKLEQLTIDHSLVEAEVRAGLLTREEAAVDRRRNILLRNLGYALEAEPDLTHERLLEGDILLLCSDGLWGEVGDEEISQILQAHDPPQAARALVESAKEHGGSDNISLIVLHLNELSGTAQATQATMTQPLRLQLKEQLETTAPKKNKPPSEKAKSEPKDSFSKGIWPNGLQWLLLIVLLLCVLLAMLYWYLTAPYSGAPIPKPPIVPTGSPVFTLSAAASLFFLTGLIYSNPAFLVNGSLVSSPSVLTLLRMTYDV